MIKQGNAAKAERGGSGGDPLPSRFSPGLPGDQAETCSQQAFRGLLRNVLDAERCLEAVPHPFVRSAGRKHGDSSRRVLDPEPSRLLGDEARQRAESHRHDRKPETRRLPACARQDRASATPQPTMTCLIHWSDSVQGAAPHEEIVTAGHFSPGDPSRQAVCSRPKRRGGMCVWDWSPFRRATTQDPQARVAQGSDNLIRTE